MSKSKILLTVIMLFMFALMSTQAQDEQPKLQVPEIFDGDTIQDFLSGDVQTRLYIFSATEGDVVTVGMTQVDDGLDPFIVLLGPAGQMIASDDDSGKESLSALIKDVELPTTGLYFVVASSFQYIDTILEADTNQELNYELSINGISKMEGDATYTYYSGHLVDGEKLTGASTAEEPVYYYTFEGKAGDLIDLEMNSDEFDTILHVFAPGGERIAVNDDAEGAGTNSAIKGLELPEDGIYMVFATDVFFYSAGDSEATLEYTGGNFDITLSFE